MLNCIYKGKRINALSVVDDDRYEYRKEIKLAGAKKQLLCEDCNNPVVLKVYTNKVSHFAHWKNLSLGCTYCDYSTAETEEHRRCKKLLYQYFLKLYPDAKVETEYRILPYRRSDVYVAFSSGEKLALDIHKRSISVAKWDDKHKDYRDAGINDLWFIAGTPYSEKEKNMPFFQQVVINESIDGIALFLNSDNGQATLMKKMTFIDSKSGKEYSDLYSKVYELEDIKILPSGKIETDFHFNFEMSQNLYCSRLIGKILEEERNTKTIEGVKYSAIKDDDLSENDSDIYAINNNFRNERFQQSTNKTINRNNQNYSKNKVLYNSDKLQMKNKMQAYINKAINGHKEYIQYLVNLIHSGPDNYYAFYEIYQQVINKVDSEVKNICEEVLKVSGFGVDD